MNYSKSETRNKITRTKYMFYGTTIVTFIATLYYVFITMQYHHKTAVTSEKIANIGLRTRQKTYEGKHLYTSRKVLIIYWTRVFGHIPTLNTTYWPYLYVGNNCPIKCEVSNDKSRVHEASALVVHARNYAEMPPKIYKNLTWILHTNENPRYSISLRNPEIMNQFNYSTSYRLDSDFPCTLFRKPSLAAPVPFSEKKGLVVLVMSRCEPVRTHYVSQLMKYIKVDSYGRCLNNKDGLARSGKGIDVLKLERNYKFSLVFTNADCDYYTTEKMHNALSAGSVPVWLGTDTIDEILQWGNLKHSIIKVKDFPSPKSLAERLLSLAENEIEYNKYLKWKYEGFQFPKEYYQTPIGIWWDGLPLYCRICMKIAEDPNGHDGLPVDRCDGNQRRTVGKWIKRTETETLTKNSTSNQNARVPATVFKNDTTRGFIKNSANASVIKNNTTSVTKNDTTLSVIRNGQEIPRGV